MKIRRRKRMRVRGKKYKYEQIVHYNTSLFTYLQINRTFYILRIYSKVFIIIIYLQSTFF